MPESQNVIDSECILRTTLSLASEKGYLLLLTLMSRALLGSLCMLMDRYSQPGHAEILLFEVLHGPPFLHC